MPRSPDSAEVSSKARQTSYVLGLIFVILAAGIIMSICSRPLQVHGKALDITVTFGVAGHEGLQGPADMVQAADDALYRAKSAGRNCVRTAESPTPAAR